MPIHHSRAAEIPSEDSSNFSPILSHCCETFIPTERQQTIRLAERRSSDEAGVTVEGNWQEDSGVWPR